MTRITSRILNGTAALLSIGLVSLAQAAGEIETVGGPVQTGGRQIVAVFILFAAGIALLYTATKWYRWTTGNKESATLPTFDGCIGWTIGSLVLFVVSIAVFGVNNIGI